MESLGDGEMNILIGHELDDLSDEERKNCLDLLMGLRLMLERGPEVVSMLGVMMRMVTELMDNDVDFEPDPNLIDAIGERLTVSPSCGMMAKSSKVTSTKSQTCLT